ncbi:MAG: metallophosphoesterase family protein [Glycocaulis sp.]
MIRIVQLADLHFGTEHPAALNGAAQIIHETRPDAIIVAGDLTQRGKRAEFEAARRWLDQFEAPRLVVAGNHDTPLLNAVSRVSYPFARFDRHFADLTAPLDIGPWRAAGLNSARGWQARSNWAEGAVRRSHIDIALSQIGDRPGILTCHHPFVPPATAPLRTRTRRGVKASAAIAPSPVRLLLTGHVHGAAADLHTYEGGAYLNLTAGTLSTRLREGHPSFNLIEIGEDHITAIAQRCGPRGFQASTLGRWQIDPDDPAFIAPT